MQFPCWLTFAIVGLLKTGGIAAGRVKNLRYYFGDLFVRTCVENRLPVKRNLAQRYRNSYENISISISNGCKLFSLIWKSLSNPI